MKGGYVGMRVCRCVCVCVCVCCICMYILNERGVCRYVCRYVEDRDLVVERRVLSSLL